MLVAARGVRQIRRTVGALGLALTAAAALAACASYPSVRVANATGQPLAVLHKDMPVNQVSDIFYVGQDAWAPVADGRSRRFVSAETFRPVEAGESLVLRAGECVFLYDVSALPHPSASLPLRIGRDMSAQIAAGGAVIQPQKRCPT
ncbi:hypothetical protein [Phenylobacterium deserti]|uniref:Lipoprotein n=1 Tax=Phenylobacterium deserti TaxID=1914756 RepID=A0A328ATK3_9CAUL|nr:hypothetical protein [Phenylobacterium deserti]RAK57016.1 hypothetical protein DJ018_03385 [Phenylobacterium deserti]